MKLFKIEVINIGLVISYLVIALLIVFLFFKFIELPSKLDHKGEWLWVYNYHVTKVVNREVVYGTIKDFKVSTLDIEILYSSGKFPEKLELVKINFDNINLNGLYKLKNDYYENLLKTNKEFSSNLQFDSSVKNNISKDELIQLIESTIRKKDLLFFVNKFKSGNIDKIYYDDFILIL